MTAFIDENKDDVVDGRRLGVEPICEVLQVAPSSYYAARDRSPSQRARRDAQLTPRLVEIWKDNYQVYGSRKLWKTARRAGIEIGRDQTARLMRQAGIQGVLRSKRVRTTRRDQAAGRHPDLVGRQFTASGPNQLWVTDLTFVATWAGVAYVCFIVDAFSRMIVGWRVAGHMRTPMVLDAIEMARWNRGLRHPGLRCHSDAGSQFTSIRYGERLAEIGATPSIGSVGDSYDKSQRSMKEGCDGQAEGVGVGSDGSWADAFAGAPAGGAPGASAAVLGGDCSRAERRGGRNRGGCVAGGRRPVVSGEWRHADCHSGPAVGPVSVVRRAGGDRAAARPG
jgi:putative transposase